MSADTLVAPVVLALLILLVIALVVVIVVRRSKRARGVSREPARSSSQASGSQASARTEQYGAADPSEPAPVPAQTPLSDPAPDPTHDPAPVTAETEPALEPAPEPPVEPPHELRTATEEQGGVDLSAPRDAWSLALAAPLALCWEEPWNRIAADDPEAMRSMLAAEWGARSRWELLDTMQMLLTRGHRAFYGDEIAMWAGLSDAAAGREEAALGEAAGRSADDAERLWRFQRVRADERAIRTTDLTAWDLVRFASLARAGSAAGFLTEDEALDSISMVAPDLRARYDSWTALGEAFHTGHWYEHSRGGAEEARLVRHDSDRASALLASAGPWASVDWEAPLPDPSLQFVDALIDEDLIDPLHASMRGIASSWELFIDDELLRRRAAQAAEPQEPEPQEPEPQDPES